MIQKEVWSGGNLGPKEIDGLLVSPGKASMLQTGHLFTGLPLRSEHAKEMWFKSNYIYMYI